MEATRRHIHANPELSNREVKTTALIAEHLRKIGLDEVRTGIAGLGVVGVLRGGQLGDQVSLCVPTSMQLNFFGLG